MLKTCLTVLAVMFVAIIGFMILDPNVSLIGTIANNINLDTGNTAKITVEIAGQVVNPGTYMLVEGDTMGTLLETAGGVTSLADAKCYFENYTVVAGMSYYIPSINDSGDLCSTITIEKVNINKEDEEGLMSISGIGSTIATAIVSYRDANGQFMCLEEIKNVNGIGNATFDKIKNSICLA
ncbi:MAG: helix-hairpin-helix domain-containing protein [Bacilli bacterium]|nr:helix-hairpin-helix domain-containing protein [Bacilli bacterium]